MGSSTPVGKSIKMRVMMAMLLALACKQVPAIAQEVTLELTLSQGIYQPQRLALAADGSILISEPRRDRVRRLGAQGTVQCTYLVDEPLAVGLDNQGRVLIGHESRVDAYNSNGTIALILGVGTGEFSKPNDLVVAADGRIFVADSPQHEVKVYAANGDYLFGFGTQGSGSGQFQFPVCLALNPQQTEIFVADQGNSRVQVFDLAGNFLRTFGQSPYQQGGQWVFQGTFTRLQGLAVDVLGRVYVADAYQNHLQVLSSEGDFLGFIATNLQGEQYFWLPMDVAIAGNKLYVASTANSQIQVFTLEDVAGTPETAPETLPREFTLFQNYPNPFNPTTSICFALPEPGQVELTIWDVQGRLVAKLADAVYPAGVHAIVWEGQGASGVNRASGLYICRLQIQDLAGGVLFTQNRKLLLVK